MSKPPVELPKREPCPFCGNAEIGCQEAVTCPLWPEKHARCTCSQCGARGPIEATGLLAVKAWNTALRPIAALIACLVLLSGCCEPDYRYRPAYPCYSGGGGGPVYAEGWNNYVRRYSHYHPTHRCR